MKRLKLTIAILFLLTAPILGRSDQVWRSISSKHFTAQFQKGDSLNARNFVTILENEFASINYEIEAKLESPIQLIIAPSAISFDKLTNGSLPHWSEAVAIPTEQTMIIKSPKWHAPSANLRITLFHELVHILIGVATNHTEIPRWFNEGLAIYISGDTKYAAGEELINAISANNTIPLHQIDAVLSFDKRRAAIAYQEAYAAISFLSSEYGHKTIPLLFKALTESHNFERAFFATLGLTPARFERDFEAHLHKKYKYPYLIHFDSYLWGGAIILFIIGGTARLISRRRRLKEMEKEERFDSEISGENEVDSWQDYE